MKEENLKILKEWSFYIILYLAIMTPLIWYFTERGFISSLIAASMVFLKILVSVFIVVLCLFIVFCEVPALLKKLHQELKRKNMEAM